MIEGEKKKGRKSKFVRLITRVANFTIILQTCITVYI